MKTKQKIFILVLTFLALLTFTPHVFATAGGFHSRGATRSYTGRRSSQWSDGDTGYGSYNFNNSYYHSTGRQYSNSYSYGFSPLSLIAGILLVGGLFFKSKNPMMRREDYVHGKEFVVQDLAQKVETNFMRIQEAWNQQNLTSIRQLYSETLYDKHQKMLDKMAEKGLTNHTHSIVIDGLSRLKQKDKAHFEIDISFVAIDFLLENNTQRVIKGNNMTRKAFKQRWSFVMAGDELKVDKIKELKIQK